MYCRKWLYLEKSKSQDNPINPLENNMTMKTKGLGRKRNYA